jgi:hypothetical protein
MVETWEVETLELPQQLDLREVDVVGGEDAWSGHSLGGDRSIASEDSRRPCEDAFGNIIPPLLLTGARRSEIAKLSRDRVLPDRLVLPPTHTKMGACVFRLDGAGFGLAGVGSRPIADGRPRPGHHAHYR